MDDDSYTPTVTGGLDNEVAAMAQIAQAFSRLDGDAGATERVRKWVMTRYDAGK